MSFITSRGVSITGWFCFFATTFSFFFAVPTLDDAFFFTPADVEGADAESLFFDVFVFEEDGSVDVDDLK